MFVSESKASGNVFIFRSQRRRQQHAGGPNNGIRRGRNRCLF